MKKILTLASIFLAYSTDIKRFLKESQVFCKKDNRQKMQGHILRLSHALEKGMAMPSPRPGFGMQKFADLALFLDEYQRAWGVDAVYAIGISSMRSILNFHSAAGYEFPEEKIALEKLEAKCSREIPEAGNKSITKKEIESTLPNSAKNFFYSRHSIRQFTGEQLSENEIKQIALLAQKTPSVCNRQGARVYFYNDPEMCRKALSLQDGNSGFGNSAGAIAIVTVDQAIFYKIGERNQAYVDGGLYAMSLVYAAHALGIGSCMLNWSQGARTDKRLRDLTLIPNAEVIITMIAFGKIPERLVVAISPRRDLADVCHINKTMST